MDPSLAELFDKLHRRFDAFEAKWSKRDAEADRRIVVLEDITETRAAHEQRTEDLRVGAPKPIEERDETPILSDNWGGKFEEPVHIAEERDDEPVASDAASPPPVMEHLTLDVAATEEVEPEVCPLQIQELEKPSPRTPASEKVVSVASTTEVVFVGFASTAQIQEREKGGKVLKSVVSMLDRDSLAQGFLSVPHLPWRAPLLRRLWRLPPRRPRPRRRRRAPLRPPRLRRPRRAPPRPPWRCRPCSSRLRGPRPAPPRRRPWRARPRSPGRRRLWGIPLRRRPRRALLRPRRAPPRRRGRPPRLLARVRGRRPRLRAGTRATERGAVLRRRRVAPCSTSAVHRANPCLSERVSALLLLNDGCRECPIGSFLSVRVGVRSLVASDAHVVIVTGEKPCVHDCCIDVSDSVHGAAVAQFTGSHSAQLASSDSLDANFATPKPDYSVFCLSVSPSNNEDYMPTNCSTDAPKLIDSGSGASIVVAMASSPTAVGTQVFNRMPGRDRALLRPLHWPSYSSYAAFVQLKSLPVVPHGMGSLFCWPEFTHFRLCHLWLPVPNSADGVLVTAAASSKCEPCAIWQLDSASSKCEPCAIWQLDSVQSEFRTNFEIAELHSVIGNSSGVFAVKSTWRGSLLGLMAMQLSCGDSESYFQWDAVREAMNKLIFKRVLIALLMYNICSYIWEVNSHTRELVTALPVLSRGKGFKFRMLNEDKSHDAVLLVFANKQDLPHSLKVAEITDKLGLYSLHQLHWYIENTCAPAVHFYGLAIEDDPPDVAQDVPTLQMQEL